MQTLSFGFKKPEVLDEGDVVFPALEQNWQKINDHNHDGVTSAKVKSSDLVKVKLNVLASNWNLVADGHYYQEVVLTGSIPYDEVVLLFKLSTGEQVFPSVSKVSTYVFRVDFDDNTQDLTCYVT